MTRKSFMRLLSFSAFLGSIVFLAVSCNTKPGLPPGGKLHIDTVLIPNPKDTSSLSRINHTIIKSDIMNLRREFNTQLPAISKNNPGLFITESEGFNKTQLLEILKDTSCVGIRIYYGIVKKDNRSELKMIIVGTDSQGKDLFFRYTPSKAAARLTDGDDAGLEYGQCCHGQPVSE